MQIAFYHGDRPHWLDRLISRVIRWKSRGRFSHVEIIFSDGWRAGATGADKCVRFTREPCDPAEWHVVPIDGDEAAAREWFEAHKGAAFDEAGAWAFLLGGELRGDDHRWFCSEAVAAALGFPDPWRFDPNTLHAVIQNRVFSSSAGPHQ